MKRVKVVLTLLSYFFCTQTWAFDNNGTITSGGRTRTFVFHAPGNSVAENLPLLFVFHGDGGTGAGIKNYAGFDAVADSQNFIVVYPNADSEGWNRAIDQSKDANFVSDLIDFFCNTYHINAKKIYASGHSAGGFMTYNLAVRLPDRIAAFAPVAGNMYATNNNFSYFSSADFKPVPIFHIHGDPDPVVTYPDPNHTPDAWSEWPLTQFAYYSCGKTTYTLPSTPVATNVTRLSFCDGKAANGKEIALIRVAGAGHGWPSVAGFNPAESIWNFVKNYSIKTAGSCASVPEVPTHMAGTIHTLGNQIVSPCDQVFIPRGVNYSLADDWEFPANMNGDPTNVNDEMSAEIIKAKPNIVRIEWFANRQPGWKPYSVADLEIVVSRFQNAGIVSVIDLHDLTCSNDYTKFNNTILPWWKQQSVLDMLTNHKGFVIVNIANEFGTVRWSADQSAAYTNWLNAYKTAITELRAAGIQVPFMIDAPDCGQSLDIAIQAGTALKNHDPLHNIIMSAHAYWYGDNAAVMESRVQQIANAPFPVVLGEIANIQDATGPCSNTIPAYTNLLQSCQNHNIGWLAWTWTDDHCTGTDGRRISINGSFSNLSTYGNTIINNPDFGLANRAVKMQASCLNTPLPVILLSFKAYETNEHLIHLEWKTSNEVNFEQFELERSEDGKRFQPIARIDAPTSGNSNRYEFDDRDLIENKYYYRLKTIDHDGSFAYSRIASIVRKNAFIVEIYPSPSHDFVIIKAKDNFFPATVKILDQSGRIVVTKLITKSDQLISMKGLKSGIYLVMERGKVIGKIFFEGN